MWPDYYSTSDVWRRMREMQVDRRIDWIDNRTSLSPVDCVHNISDTEKNRRMYLVKFYRLKNGSKKQEGECDQCLYLKIYNN